MKNHSKPVQFATPIALVLVIVVSVAQLGAAADAPRIKLPPIKLSHLKGPWQMTLTGNTSCGISTNLLNFTLNSKGSGSATMLSHTSGCGDIESTGVPFLIESLNSNGSGTANLSCGSGCGWEFNIQVNHDGTIFNLVDVDPNNPGNYFEGTAIRQ
jgi:hypothetical protein